MVLCAAITSDSYIAQTDGDQSRCCCYEDGSLRGSTCPRWAAMPGRTGTGRPPVCVCVCVCVDPIDQPDWTQGSGWMPPRPPIRRSVSQEGTPQPGESVMLRPWGAGGLDVTPPGEDSFRQSYQFNYTIKSGYGKNIRLENGLKILQTEWRNEFELERWTPSFTALRMKHAGRVSAAYERCHVTPGAHVGGGGVHVECATARSGCDTVAVNLVTTDGEKICCHVNVEVLNVKPLGHNISWMPLKSATLNKRLQASPVQERQQPPGLKRELPSTCIISNGQRGRLLKV